MIPYVAWLAKTNYSFLCAASHAEDLVETAAKLGLKGICLADNNGFYGIVKGFAKGKEVGLPVYYGVHLCVYTDSERLFEPNDSSEFDAEQKNVIKINGLRKDGGEECDVDEELLQTLSTLPNRYESSENDPNLSKILLICKTIKGYQNLCHLISIGQRRCDKNYAAVTWNEVLQHADGVIACLGGEDSIVAQVAHRMVTRDHCSADIPLKAILSALKSVFRDDFYAILFRHQREIELESEVFLRELATDLSLPLVASNEVLFHSRCNRPLLDVLLCIRHKTTLKEAGRLLPQNNRNALQTPEEFYDLFSDLPDAIERTNELAAKIDFTLDDLHYRYPNQQSLPGQTPHQRLIQLATEGMQTRARDAKIAIESAIYNAYEKQLAHELRIIAQLDYAGYFLTMWEIVQFCKLNGILCQGRGSAANSCVCYFLGITAVDPVRNQLLFERFLSIERAEPPDIDLDIEHKRREEVIQYVYRRFGREHAAMVANVVRFKARSAIREVGKIFAIDEPTVEKLAKLTDRSAIPDGDRLQQYGIDVTDARMALYLEVASRLIETPRHLSIHPGGFLLGSEPLHRLVPIENATMERRTVVQWDKYDVETLGLFKLDLLGLGGLTLLQRSFELVNEWHGLDLSMAKLPADDKRTYDICCEANTVGVFQIESRGQMSFLPRMKPRCLYDLVIEVAIIRPGPISGDMVHPYLRRRNGEEAVTYPHPLLKKVLERTLGVPLFQEQVMQLAMLVADYTAGEADQLRRDMGAWRSQGKLEKHRKRLLTRMRKKGIKPEFAERIYQQIQGFGEYGFPESHAASFALITYATAYMKANYPAEFTCALLQAQPLGFYSRSTIIEDAKRNGVIFAPPDIQTSEWEEKLEIVADKLVVRLGLNHVRGLKFAEWERVESARKEQIFQSLRDLFNRTGLSINALKRLAEGGALSSFGTNRRNLLWEIGSYKNGNLTLPFENQMSLEFEPLTFKEEIIWDYASTGISNRGHPMATVREYMKGLNVISSADILKCKGGEHVNHAALVICRQRPETSNGVVFFTLEDEYGFSNIIVWKNIYERQRPLARTAGFLGITGKVQTDGQTWYIIAEYFWIPPLHPPNITIESRNFR